MDRVNDALVDVPAQEEGVRATRVKVRCRHIEEDDLDSVVRLLRIGFPDRSEAYWRTGLERHRSQPLPDDVPRYGYVLDRDGAIVGVLLALYRTVTDEAGTHLRCNLSSWYVLPEFRALGTLLDGFAMRDRRVTYTNVSPAPQTWQMHKARGFKPVCSGQMLVMPLLAGFGRGRRVRAADAETLRLLPEPEARLVADHIAYGCIGLVCSEGDRAWAVLFQRRAIRLRPGETRWPRLPCLQLVYRSSALDLPAFLGAIGRHLILRHAMPWFVLDAVGKLPGMAGRFFDGRAPKYARGPNPPATGDLTYTEAVLFGA
ncbi:hypothetical protein H0176_03530 [Methylorubrum populi]|jgi:hypothetical protein|uniref:N-acetyltransferase domain-containing protein n=2 Tax=Pseudomonadota TaxID=1224 RepID=A0ABU9ZIT5_9HYPH|nr:hypothetical protein [Methylorubrum rhodesianum]MBK3405469.1 hypothetical protein [Methylorubrum rhodesianum]MBY0139343.1 hypothetical protein [Methylorubrum populi]